MAEFNYDTLWDEFDDKTPQFNTEGNSSSYDSLWNEFDEVAQTEAAIREPVTNPYHPEYALNFPDETSNQQFATSENRPSPELMMHRDQQRLPSVQAEEFLRNNSDPEGILDFGKRALAGVVNAPQNAIETGAALADYAFDTESLEAIQEAMRAIGWDRYKPEMKGTLASGMVGDIVEEGASFATGAVAFSKVAEKSLKALKGIRGGKVGRAVALEGAGVAALDPETESLVGVLEILGADANGDYSDEVALRKLNLMIEGLALAKGIEVTAKTAGGAAKLVNEYIIQPLKTIGDSTKLEDTVVGELLLGTFRRVGLKDTPQQIADEMDHIINAVDKGKGFNVPSGIEGVSDISIKRDTASALEAGLPEPDPSMVSRARTARSGVVSRGGAPELDTALAQPSFAGDEYLTSAQDAFGGREAARGSREAIQESALRDTDAYLDEVRRLDTKILESEKGIKAFIENDPELGKVLTDLGDELNIARGTGVREKANEIVGFIQKASDEMTAIKNDLYDAIPDRAIVNTEDYSDALSMVDDILPDSFKTKLEEAGMNFKELNKLVSSKDFNKIISDLKRSDLWEDVGRLRSFKEAVSDDQLDYFILSGDSEIADAARAAKEYYSETYAPYWRNNPALRDIQQYSRDFKFNTDMNVQKSRTTLVETISDPNKAEYTQKISEVLDTPEGGRNATKLLDYSLGEVALDAQRMINSNPNGKLTPEQINSLSRRIEDFVPIFEKHPGQVDRINTFLNKLRDKAFSTKELKQALKEAEATAEKAKKEILSTKGMDKFFDSTGGLKTNTTEIFSSSFKDVEQLPDIIKRAGPDGLPGIKSQYMDEVQDAFLSNKEGISGQKIPKDIQKRDLETLLEAGDIIFKDTPEVMGAVRAIEKELARSRAGTGRGKLAMDIGSARKSGAGAADFLVTQIWGPLNRWGSRIRSAAGRAIASTNSEQEMKLILDRVMSDPEEFVRIARRVSDNFRKKNPIPNEDISDIYRFFTTSYLAGRGSPEDEMQFIEDFKNQFNEDYQTEEVLR